VQYKTEASLSAALHKLSREHDYTTRFEQALARALSSYAKGKKKRMRTLGIKLVHAIDGRNEVRRAEVVQRLQAQAYTGSEIEVMLKKLHTHGVIVCSVGRSSKVRVA
jgi:hypothetical protein